MQRICTPAIVYLVVGFIATILTLVFRYNFGRFLSNLASLIACFLILVGICNIEPRVSWLITITFIILTISGSVMVITKKTEDIIYSRNEDDDINL